MLERLGRASTAAPVPSWGKLEGKQSTGKRCRKFYEPRIGSVNNGSNESTLITIPGQAHQLPTCHLQINDLCTSHHVITSYNLVQIQVAKYSFKYQESNTLPVISTIVSFFFSKIWNFYEVEWSCSVQQSVSDCMISIASSNDQHNF